jgi:L-fuculose-phosphate aldolase
MNINYIHPADQLVMFMQRIYDKGLTTTSGGNLSIMDNEGNIWITPAGVDKGTLTRNDIICVKPDGTITGPHKPSSEFPFHASVYKMRPDLKAVLHAHPPALVAFSIAGRIPNLDLIPSIRRICQEAKVAVYGVPGSEDLGDKIGAVFAEGCDIAILENHGVCIGAQDMFTAFQRFETLNFAADLEIQATRIGKIKCLNEDQHRIAVTNHHTKLDDFIPRTFTSEELSARRDMITLIRRSYKQGLFTATHGTYSVRLADDSFLITPFGQDRAYLEEDDLVRVKGGMKELGKVPSRAVHLHEAIYKNHPEIRAVLQAHPVHAMAFAITDAGFDPRTIPESYILLRDIKKLPYGEIYDSATIATEFNVAHPAMMVENNCVIVTGNSLLQAFDRLEVLEATAHSLINAGVLGELDRITDEEVEDLKKAFNLMD